MACCPRPASLACLVLICCGMRSPPQAKGQSLRAGQGGWAVLAASVPSASLDGSVSFFSFCFPFIMWPSCLSSFLFFYFHPMLLSLVQEPSGFLATTVWQWESHSSLMGVPQTRVDRGRGKDVAHRSRRWDDSTGCL